MHPLRDLDGAPELMHCKMHVCYGLILLQPRMLQAARFGLALGEKAFRNILLLPFEVLYIRT